ncbi:MAG: radical SAM/SPASM domain-containing protein [Bacteroidia bacterium]
MSKAQIFDTIEYIKSLTPRRVFNIFKVYVSYVISKMLKKNLHRGNPISVSIEPTTACNLRCPECPSGMRSFSRPTGSLDVELNISIIDQLKEDLTYITYYFQGEPYLNQDFTRMVSYASKVKIYTATSTNGHYLTDENCKKTIESGLKKIIVSVDGVSQSSFAKYRVGGNLEKVIEGTKNILHWKKKLGSRTPLVEWQFIVFSHNEHEIERVNDLAKDLAVDRLTIKTAQIYDFENGNELIPINNEYSRYRKNQDRFTIKNRLLNHCWRMWSGCVITWDGKVVPCCFDKDGAYQLGKLENMTFKSIWEGVDYNRFRKLILKSRSNIDICRNCSEGTKKLEMKDEFYF